MMRLSEIIPTLNAVSKLQLQAQQQSAMNDSDCESLDSGLETGNSGLETSENGFVTNGDTDSVTDNEDDKNDSAESNLSDFSEGIYENAAILKSTNMSIAAEISTLEKYEFGNETINNSTDDFNEEDEEEIEEPAGDDLDSDSDIKTEPVSFQDIENFESPPVESIKKSWGVRQDSVSLRESSERSSNPTEEKIAKEIRELKEREEELARLREEQQSAASVNTDTDDASSEVSEVVSEKIIEEEKPVKITSNNIKPISSNNNNSSKFNPAHYGPCIMPSRPKAGIMQNFINNKGKVNAFKTTDTIVTLRKPQVYKSVPKVSPPVGSTMTRRDGNVIDKIQAELAETKRREDELRRQRRDMFRSQPDLRSIEDRVVEGENLENNGNLAEYSGSSDAEEEEDAPSMVCTRGKSALISVWENRIQCEKAA